MGVAKKPTKMPKGENLLAAIVAQVQELGTKHMAGILEFLDEGENKKEKVTFGCEIDMSESEPLVTVSIRYSQSVTDKRSVQLDDPNQGTFTEVIQGAEQQKKGKGKKGAEQEPPAE